jgi:formate dehydrogenase subunit gamma
MSATPVDTNTHGADVAVQAGQEREDIVVGNEIVRHKLSTRAVHFAVMITFLVCLATGFPIWTPFFSWMATLFGGLAFCRWLHPLAGAGFAVSSLLMFIQWVGDMHIADSEKKWLSPAGLMKYLRYQDDNSDVGKYNPGQKLQFWCSILAALGLLVSGLVMWFPTSFPQLIRESAYLIHEITFILLVMLIVWHVYLGTAAEPGTFQSITRGTVTKAWAKLHHPKWYRDVTGQK